LGDPRSIGIHENGGSTDSADRNVIAVVFAHGWHRKFSNTRDSGRTSMSAGKPWPR
jgi:hypothetical protein